MLYLNIDMKIKPNVPRILKQNKVNKVIIFPGSFDPIHIGHITLALEALHKLKVDELYFLPERIPRNKEDVEHFGHRVAMLREAIKPYPKLKILEVEDNQFDVKRTLPKLQNYFFDQKIAFLFGSDKLLNMDKWPHFEYMLKSSEFIIGTRQGDKIRDLKMIFRSWKINPKVKLIKSYAPNISSSMIRDALYENKLPEGLLKSVLKYIRQNWLYVSVR